MICAFNIYLQLHLRGLNRHRIYDGIASFLFILVEKQRYNVLYYHCS